MNNSSIFFNNTQLSLATNFSIFIVSIIVFVDFLIKFRRPLIIKFIFLLLVFTIGFGNLLVLINLNFTLLKISTLFLKTIGTISILQLLTNLFFPHFKKLVNILSSIIFTFALITFIFRIFNGYSVIPVNSFIYQNEYNPFDNDLHFPKFLIFFRTLFSIIFIYLILYFNYQILVNFNHNNIYFKKIKYFSYAIILYVFLIILWAVFKQILNFTHPTTNIIISFLLNLFLLLIFFNRPEFLNRSSHKIGSIHRFITARTSYNIDETSFNMMFFNQMFFLNKQAKVENFAKLMNVSKDVVTNYVENEFGLDFEDLLNKSRIDYFIRIIKEPKYQNMTIDALAKESGFVSRNAFYKPFKKFHGGNPSDLIDFNI